MSVGSIGCCHGKVDLVQPSLRTTNGLEGKMSVVVLRFVAT